MIHKATQPTKKVTDNPIVIEQVRLAIEAIGFNKITASLIDKHLKSNFPQGMIAPSFYSIKVILKKHFHLRFKAAKPAMVKYIDPTYNERRLWVSRLLAQFFKEKAVIISIDESNFRLDAFKRRKWVFAPT